MWGNGSSGSKLYNASFKLIYNMAQLYGGNKSFSHETYTCKPGHAYMMYMCKPFFIPKQSRVTNEETNKSRREGRGKGK